MDTLPADCINLIVTEILEHDKFRRVCDVAVDAANLMLVGNHAFTALSIEVQEKLEPTGRKTLLNLWNKMRLAENVCNNSPLKILQKECRDRDLKVSGTKAALWERLTNAIENARPPKVCILSADFQSQMRYQRKARICASNARSEYRLTEKDLSDLPCEYKTNPVYKTAAPMRLYFVRDVISVALEKQKLAISSPQKRRSLSKAELIERRRSMFETSLDFDIDPRIFTFSDTAQAARHAYVNSGRVGELEIACRSIRNAMRRMRALELALRECGCELRADSKLCTRFIDYGQGNIPEIVVTMREMEFYYTHTNYKNILDELWRDARASQNHRYDHHYSDSDDDYDRIDPHELSESAKHIALRRWVQLRRVTRDNLNTNLDAYNVPQSLHAPINVLIN